ncbi:MAG: AAA family ATPase [bacterium]|nr:AAA family ATPase [bacterium]
MNIILIGFMGSGKSTVGKAIAKKMSFEFREMDALILEQTGFADMKALFLKKGESLLRESEIALSKELALLTNTVVSTGGGVVMNKIIIDTFKKHSAIVFYLHAPFELLTKHIASDSTPRPLFNTIEKAQSLFEFRLPLYKNLSDHTIDIQEKSVEEIADEIIHIYNTL